MVAGAVLVGHVYGTSSVPQYDPGQSGQAERMLDSLHVVTPPSESVLVQSRLPGPQVGFVSNRHVKLAAHEVVDAAYRSAAGGGDVVPVLPAARVERARAMRED